MSLISQLESLLFVASKSLMIGELARILQCDNLAVSEALQSLEKKYNVSSSGIHILHAANEVRMGTNPAHSALINKIVKDEIAEDLTKAQLETLTVVAYRSPLTRSELEQIRGVNCAVILRNLLIRGLIEEKENTAYAESVYTLSLDALRHLGIVSTVELPEYKELSHHENIEAIILAKE